VDNTSNKTLFRLNVGIPNTSVVGQMYMNGNALATSVALINTFYKVAGVTLPGNNNEKYTVTDNRLTNGATIRRKFMAEVTLSFSSGSNNVIEFAIYESVSGLCVPSRTKSTANAVGRAENISLMCIIEHADGDYVELWVANTSASTDVTVTEMNFIVSQL